MSQVSDAVAADILGKALAAFSSGSNWVQVYQAILDAVTTTTTVLGPDGMSPSTVTTPNDGVDPTAVAWISGAKGVNGNDGAFAAFIRGYTDLQYSLRAGSANPDVNALQRASNQIASNFTWQFLFGTKPSQAPRAPSGDIDWSAALPAFNASVPSIHDIGAIDAAGAAAQIFNGPASSTGESNFSPWAGTVLFTDLGDSSFFHDWILKFDAETTDDGAKVESGTYDLIAAAEAINQSTRISSTLSLLASGQLGTLLDQQITHYSTISQATADAQAFFQAAYGAGSQAIQIASVIFNPVDALLTGDNAFQVGTVHGGALNLRSGTSVLNSGAGDDAVSVDAMRQLATGQNPVVILDGDSGKNTLAYANNGVPLTVTLQNQGHWNFREKIDLAVSGKTEYAYNFQTLKLTGDGNIIKWASNFSPSNVDTAAAISIEENAPTAGGINTVDFSQATGNFTYNNGAVADSSITFSGFSTLIGASGGKEVYNISTSSSGSAFSRYVGGDSLNTFNVSYTSSSAKPLLLMADALGGDTFNFNSVENAGFTVAWGGAGDNIYNFRADPSVHVNIIELDMAGITREAVQRLDLDKLQAYVESRYSGIMPTHSMSNGDGSPASSLAATTPEIVILNPGETDTITYNGVKIVSPQLAFARQTESTVVYSPPTQGPPDPIYTVTATSTTQSYGLVHPGYAPFIDDAPLSTTTYPNGWQPWSDPGFLALTLRQLAGPDVPEWDWGGFSVDNFNQGDFGITLPTEVARTSTQTEYSATQLDPNTPSWREFRLDGVDDQGKLKFAQFDVEGIRFSSFLKDENGPSELHMGGSDLPPIRGRWVGGEIPQELRDEIVLFGWVNGADGQTTIIDAPQLAPATRSDTYSESYDDLFASPRYQQPLLDLNDYLLPANQGGGEGGGPGASQSSDVSHFQENRTVLDATVGGFSIIDTAANVSAQLDALSSDANVNAIVLTDSGTPQLTLSASQLTTGATVLAAITNANYAVAVSDTAANVSAAFDSLGAANQVTSIALTDAGTPTLALTAAQALDGGVLAKVVNSGFSIAISDTSANVARQIDALNDQVRLGSITLVDVGAAVLDLSIGQVVASDRALSAITNSSYLINARGSVADVKSHRADLNAIAHLASINVIDSAANIVANLNTFDGDAGITSITVVDTTANIAANAAVFDADPKVTARVAIDTATNVLAAAAPAMATQVVDSAANVAASLDALNSMSLLSAITLSDPGTPVLVLTVGQAVDDAAALGKITNASFGVSVRDTAGHVSENLDALNVYDVLTTITLTDSGTPTLALSVSQLLDDSRALAAIGNADWAVTVSTTAADLSANLKALSGVPRLSSIMLTDGGTPTLRLTAGEVVGDETTLAKIGNAYAIAVSDSAAEVATHFDALSGIVALASINLTDSGTPTLHLSAAQALGGSGILGRIAGGSYAISIDDSVRQLVDNATVLAVLPQVVGFVATDTVANILGNEAALASIGCQSALVRDTAANVVASLAALDALPLVGAVQLTDAATSPLTLSVSQLLGNSRILRAIVNANYEIALADTAANVVGKLDVLVGVDSIVSITFIDSSLPPLRLNVIEALANNPLLGKVTNANIDVVVTDTAEAVTRHADALSADPHVDSVAVVDTAENVSAHFAALAAIDRISAITFTDNSAPVLLLTASQVLGSTGMFGKITNANFAIGVSDTADHIAGNSGTLAAVPHVQSITVHDTVANVLAHGAALSGDTAITTIAITDTLANVAANGAALRAFPNLALTVSGTAAEIATNIDALHSVGAVVAIVPTEPGAITLNLTAAQALGDGDVIGKIQTFVIVKVVDSAANISANFEALASTWQVHSITLTDADTVPLTLSAAQLSNGFMASAKITNDSYSIAIADTVANLMANYFFPISGDPKVTSVAVVDTAANVLEGHGDLGFLLSIEPRFRVITVRDSSAEMVANLDALNADEQITAVVVVDAAGSIASNLRALDALARVETITLTDSGRPVLQLALDEAMASVGTLAKIDNASYALVLEGSRTSIEALTVPQIAVLGGLHTETISALDGSVTLSAEQTLALVGAGIVLSVPADGRVTMSDRAALIGQLTASGIAALSRVGVSAVVVTDTSVTFTPEQTAAIVAANLVLSAAAGATVTENFADGSQVLLTFGPAGSIASQTLVTVNGSRAITVHGDNVSVTDDGASNVYIDITGEADNSWTSMTGARNTTTVSANGAAVYDSGSGNTTILNGEHSYAVISGTSGTVIDTGDHNNLGLYGTQNVTVSGNDTMIANHGDGMTIDLTGDLDRMDMDGSGNAITASGHQTRIDDNGTNNVVTLSGSGDAAFMAGTGGTVISTGANNYIELHGSQTVTVTGANNSVLNAGTSMAVTFDADHGSMTMTGSNNTTTMNGDWAAVYDSGSGNTTLLNGEHSYAVISGTSGTVISTGDHNNLGLYGTQNVTVSGNDTMIANHGDGMTIDLTGDQDRMDMDGSGNAITASGHQTRIDDDGTNNLVTLAGTGDAAFMQGTGGTVISTGANNYIELHGSQTVTVTGANNSVLNAGSGMAVTFDVVGSMTMTGSNNTTTMNGDNVSVYDSGSGNTTILNGDNAYVVASGTAGVVTGSGSGALVSVTTSDQTISLSNASIGLGDGVSVVVSGDDDLIAMGSGAKLTLTGTGNDVVHVTGDGASDIATFGSGVTYDRLWFQRSNDDLVMSVIGEDRSLTVTDWYTTASHHVGEVDASGGYTLSDSGVEALVQAMAAFSPPPQGQTSLSPSVAASLAPSLAANWQHT